MQRRSAAWWREYREYLESPEWAGLRKEALARDGHVCQDCGKRRATVAHHDSYDNVGCGELDEIAWFSWEEAEALDLPSITRAILADVAARLHDPARPIPYHRFDNGRHRLLTL